MSTTPHDKPESQAEDRQDAVATGRAGHNGVLFAMCLSLVLVVASVSALNLALPDLAIDLSATNGELTWIADGYTVALAALVLPLGAIGDRIGRRNVLVAGTVVFGAASLAASFADSTTTLIVWRVVMGLGAAMIMPGTLSTITAAFPPEQRVKGVATWSGFAAAGAIIGMLAAGALLEWYSWRSIFITSAAAALVAAVAALLLAPDTKDERPSPPDVSGAISTAVGIGALVFAIIEGNERGWTEPVVIAALVVMVLAFTVYAWLGLRREHPLLDPALFGIRGFRAGAITVLVQFMAVFGFFFVGLQYLQLILGYSPLKAAAALVPVAVVVLPTSQATPHLVRRVGMKLTMTAGLLLLSAGLFVISRLDVGSGYLPFLGGLVLAGLGIGLSGAVGTSAITGSLGRGQQGVASAMNDTTREVGSAVGIALMGSIYGSHYRSNLPDSVDRLPHEAAEAARDSAAAGLHVADQLGARGAALADGVKSAFMDGLSASLVAVGVIVLAAAIGCLLRAPKTPPTSD
ncbi:MFS transporter [Streptomyces californicus]|uniref:MFS transporter n=1 Tax=Streptomyces TaxID=1883 RepID=UPI000883A560|nr:MFS transporter [Streptomyces sp. LaPpAH-199]MYW78056.1 MFS transporter [Streptomyces sp. SID8369]NEA09151.1 MFS transporter [Streptomyces sp. SID10692]SDC59005.1 drug resistance transporter, EmrB/QacA subfamily [Streptomyces sp. LaPpAH-199]